MTWDEVADRLLFLGKFLRDGRRVASLAPSSAALARAACAKVDRGRPQAIVELGAGTGAVTERILARCHPSARVVAVELDADFASVLRRRCPDARVVQGDALELEHHLDVHGITRVDVLVSGLALPSLTSADRRLLLDAFARRAAAGAWFSQLTVLPLVYRKLYRGLFHQVHFEWAAWNVPPGGVYHCRGVRGAPAEESRARAVDVAAHGA